MSTFLVCESWNDTPLYESLAFIHVAIASFTPSKLSSDWMALFVNKLMEPHCNGLDKDEAWSSYLDGTLHMLTQTPIYSIAASIKNYYYE